MMSVLTPEGDDFDRWCIDNGVAPIDKPAAFVRYMVLTTGWDGGSAMPFDIPCP